MVFLLPSLKFLFSRYSFVLQPTADRSKKARENIFDGEGWGGRENACEYVRIDFAFTSEWRTVCKTTAQLNVAKPNTNFDFLPLR